MDTTVLAAQAQAIADLGEQLERQRANAKDALDWVLRSVTDAYDDMLRAARHAKSHGEELIREVNDGDLEFGTNYGSHPANDWAAAATAYRKLRDMYGNAYYYAHQDDPKTEEGWSERINAVVKAACDKKIGDRYGDIHTKYWANIEARRAEAKAAEAERNRLEQVAAAEAEERRMARSAERKAKR